MHGQIFDVEPGVIVHVEIDISWLVNLRDSTCEIACKYSSKEHGMNNKRTGAVSDEKASYIGFTVSMAAEMVQWSNSVTNGAVSSKSAFECINFFISIDDREPVVSVTLENHGLRLALHVLAVLVAYGKLLDTNWRIESHVERVT